MPGIGDYNLSMNLGQTADAPPLPETLDVALKEWAVAVRALREGRQVMLLRKGGILDAGGQFEVEARDVLLFPTYLHEDEQLGSLQPCYGAWVAEEGSRRAAGAAIRIDAWARITDVVSVAHPEELYRLSSQHIYSDKFLKYRIENEPQKPLYAVFLRTYALPRSVVVGMEPNYYGCKSWITLESVLDTAGSVPCMGDHAYEARVRVTADRLSHGSRVA